MRHNTAMPRTGGPRSNSGRKPGWEARQLARLREAEGLCLKACFDHDHNPFTEIINIARAAFGAENFAVALRANETLAQYHEATPRAAAVAAAAQAPAAIVHIHMDGNVPPVIIEQPAAPEAHP